MTAQIQAISQAISQALLHFLWQGAAVALLLWITLAILGRRPARLRYAVSCAAFALMSALPFVTAFLVYRAPGATVSSVAGGSITDVPAVLAAPTFLPQLLAAIEAWALPVWSAGVMLLAIRFLRGATHVTKLKRSGEPVGLALAETASRLARRMGITKSLRVLTSALADSPSVVGFLKPVILFPPAALMNLSTSQLESVLAHELAHIRRHDYLVNMLQTIAETLFFYQPAIWWVSSRIRSERELCCDDMVVELCGDPVGYARALTQLERSRLATPSLAPTLTMSSAGGPLMHRIQRLTGVAEHQPAPRVSAALAAGLAMVCFLVNLPWAKAQSGQEGNFKLDSVWTDTVKFGNLSLEVRGLGSLISPTTAQLNIAPQVSSGVQIGQNAIVALRSGITAPGKVTRIDSPAGNGTVPVTVELQASISASTGQEIDGTIHIKTLHDVMFVGRPINVASLAQAGMFKLESDGQHWSRVAVRFGVSSVNAIQVASGLNPGDKIIISDMAAYSAYDRLLGQ